MILPASEMQKKASMTTVMVKMKNAITFLVKIKIKLKNMQPAKKPPKTEMKTELALELVMVRAMMILALAEESRKERKIASASLMRAKEIAETKIVSKAETQEESTVLILAEKA
jgi:hypothetical protein